MILFLEDWDNYPTAIVDEQTTNKSFVRIAAVYRSMGIKNHAFMLALINPALQGVDPHSPDLTQEQMGMIAYECKINPWYFFREVARAPSQGSPDPVPIEANRGNIALWWCFFNHIFVFLIQCRQTGKSFSTDVLMMFLLNIGCIKTKMNLITKDDDLRRENIKRMKDIGDNLPRYLDARTRADASNTEEITVQSLGNFYNTHVSQGAIKAALNLGRGLTSAIMHWDEAPFQKNISISLPAAMAATIAAADQAKRNNSYYGTIVTTTAGKKDDQQGKYVYQMLMDSAVWSEFFFDCENAADLERTVRVNSRTGEYQVNCTFGHQQLGKDDAWLMHALETTKSRGADADRDYFNIWTSGSQSNPLGTANANKIRGSEMPDQYTDISKPNAYITRWYIPEEAVNERLDRGQYVVAQDPSEASGGDDISLVLVDIETGEVLAAGTYNETNVITFAEWFGWILINYPTITAIIEKRSMGQAVIDVLLRMLPIHGEDPFRRIFNRVVNDQEEYPERFKQINMSMGRRDPGLLIQNKKHFGFATSATGMTSRSELYSTTLEMAMKYGGDRVRDKALIDQLLGLVRRNDRIDHEVGEHDDLVIAWLLCFWLMTQGKYLEYYGITKRILGRALPESKLSPEEARRRQEQVHMAERIETLYTELTSENDETLAMKIEQEIRFLDRLIDHTENEVLSVDELIKRAKEQRRQKSRRTASAGYSVYNQTNHAQWQHQGGFSDEPLTVEDVYGRRPRR